MTIEMKDIPYGTRVKALTQVLCEACAHAFASGDVILGSHCLRCSLYAMKEQLESKQVNWISVKDRLPEHRQLVLASDGTDMCTRQYRVFPDGDALWSAYGWSGYEWEYDFEHDKVTHWMPLPEPPEEK